MHTGSDVSMDILVEIFDDNLSANTKVIWLLAHLSELTKFRDIIRLIVPHVFKREVNVSTLSSARLATREKRASRTKDLL